MSLSFQKATKSDSFLRMALCGGPGAGKTWTSLALATGLGHKIALIDTERGSARKYASDFNFDVCELESFHPDHYIDGMVAAYQAGYEVLVIDSLSHAWAGKDGALELVDRARATGKDNQFTAWRHVTPLQHKLVDTMLRLPMHLIVTLRTKVAYVIEADHRGKQVPRKVGMAPIQREGCEYEFDVIGELNSDGLTITKTRLRLLQGLTLTFDPQQPIAPGQALGRRMAADLQGEPEAPTSSAPVEAPVQQVEPQQLKQLWSAISQHRVDHEVFRDYLAGFGLHSTKELTPAQLELCLSEIETRQGQAFQRSTAIEAEADTSSHGTRAQLFEALSMLQAVIAEAEETQPPGEPYAQRLIELAEWLPRVARACENPETPEDQLQSYLIEVKQSLDHLQEMELVEATA